ncbi:tetratricopeptide repeat protein [Aromatoleum evansii]|uniref:tetratricopeptide repeat protein n=1 Tax=Aromatoleum evansii TaxID=59406 RepID=UPI00145F4C9C|nr:tetratricopeptide repeat protein [Aromatoleum evansii]NMG29418.1 tetratricopeptide repeat protein [Aromatoleum evansii]
MKTTDLAGNPLSATDDAAFAHYARALQEFHCYRSDPVATINAATAIQPDFVMGHVLHAWLHLLGTEPEGLAVARDDAAKAAACAPNRREQAHLDAIAHFAGGRWEAAGRVLEDLAIEWPRDILALQAGHLVDFYRGDSRMLRDRIARALPAWDASLPGYHALLGMHAFGCEETGDYRRAEAQGRRALELEPGDSWAHHALAHVIEMEGRSADGIAWMRERRPHWAEDNFFAVHNWWHLAMFHLDRDEIDEALALFDGPIHGPRSVLMLDLIDASALLCRLQFTGIDVAARWASVADCWRTSARPGLYSFNDLHAMMAWLGAGQDASAGDWMAAQRHLDAAKIGDHAALGTAVGEPLLRAFADLAAGRYEAAIETLRTVRPIAHRFGGSHAQRDLIDLALVEAALRGGRAPLARALINERLARKPDSAINRRLVARLPR